jgi:hypothetical protein
MRRLQKFVERGAYGEGSGRTAYVLDLSSLPPAADGMGWKKIEAFNAADEVFNDPGLKAVFKTAIEKGSALVMPEGELGLKAKGK